MAELADVNKRWIYSTAILSGLALLLSVDKLLAVVHDPSRLHLAGQLVPPPQHEQEQQPLPAAATAAATAAAAADCPTRLHQGSWQPLGHINCSSELAPSVAACSSDERVYWLWGDASCGQRRWERQELYTLLADTTIHFAGDSHVRFMYNTFAAAFQGTPLPPFYHGNGAQHINSTNTTLAFFWAPYTKNIDRLFPSWGGKKVGIPDILITGSGHWHVHQEREGVVQYARSLRRWRAAADELAGRAAEAGRRLDVVWLSFPPLPPRLEYFGQQRPQTVDAVYHGMAAHAPAAGAGSAFHIVDLYHLVQGCVQWCVREDNTHAKDVVNEVVLQIIMNMLLAAQ